MLNIIAAAKQEDMKLYGNVIMNNFARCRTLPVVRNFTEMFAASDRVKLIAEVKKASPSKGVFLHDFDPVSLAAAYEQNGAGAISVITEERYFLGHPGYIALIKDNTRIPVLRKDFIIDERQLYESRLLGADAVLLIARLVPDRLRSLVELAQELGLEPLVEAHDRDEVNRALDTPARVIGINNRNLENFSVNIETCLDLKALVPDHIFCVAESGIFSAADILKLEKYGFRGALVGEALVTAGDTGAKTRELAQYKGDNNG